MLSVRIFSFRDEFRLQKRRTWIPTMTTNAAGWPRTDGRWIFRWVLIASAASITTAEPAHAYLDPATGSMIIQIVTGTVLGAILIVKTYWRRIKGYFSTDSSDTTGLREEARPPDDDE